MSIGTPMTFGRIAFPVSVLGFLAAVALPAASAMQAPPAPPPGPGLTLINAHCGFCHPPAQAISVRKTRANWEAVVQSMIDRGAELEPAEQAVVVNYLATNMAPAGEAGAPSAANGTR
jgi:hypothetical protein